VAWYSLFVHVHNITLHSLQKNTVNLLTHVESYAEYYTNQEYDLFFWNRDEMNDLTYRIYLSAVETKHSTALPTATGLSQEWPTRIGELICVEAYLTIFAGHAIKG